MGNRARRTRHAGLLATLGLGTLVTLASCGAVRRADVVVDRAAESALDPAHVHSAHCGHYLERGALRTLPGHVHGPCCGHVWRRGAWRAE